MKSNPKFERDYLAALVQLSRQTAPVRLRDPRTKKWVTQQFPILSINGVPIQEQIDTARRAL